MTWKRLNRSQSDFALRISVKAYSPGDSTSDVLWGQFGHVARAYKTHGSYGEAANEASDVELGERVGGGGLNDSADDENDTSDHQGTLTSDPVAQWGTNEGTEEAGEGCQR